MASAATSISDKQLDAELRQLQTDATTLQKKLDDDTRKFGAASTDRQRIVEGIARGTVNESEAPANEAEIKRLQTRNEGTKGLLDANKARTNEVTLEINRRQGVIAKAAREKAFAELSAAGKDSAEKIFDLLTHLVTVAIPAFDEIRWKLANEYRDLGGYEFARGLREMLVKYPGPKDTMHDPNVHLWRLFDQGWVLAGADGPSHRPFRVDIGVMESVPGGPLELRVPSLRPKK